MILFELFANHEKCKQFWLVFSQTKISSGSNIGKKWIGFCIMHICSKIEKSAISNMYVWVVAWLPQRLKSTFFEISSNGAAQKKLLKKRWF